MCVELLGFRRGMMNALCDDMTHNPGQLSRITDFLSLFNFPGQPTQPSFSGIRAATLLVEQSFSDFGDLDLLILLEYDQESDLPKK